MPSKHRTTFVFPCPVMTSLHPSEEFRQVTVHAEILSSRLDDVRE